MFGAEVIAFNSEAFSHGGSRHLWQIARVEPQPQRRASGGLQATDRNDLHGIIFKCTSINQMGGNSMEILMSDLMEIKDRPVKYNAQIRDLDDDHYKLTEPVLALIENYPGDTVIASFPEIEAFGEGSTESEAVLNLKHAILDLYDELSADPPESLGELPKAWLRVLQRLIRES